MQIGIALVASQASSDPHPSGDAPRSDTGARKVLDIDFWAIEMRSRWALERIACVRSVDAKKKVWAKCCDMRRRKKKKSRTPHPNPKSSWTLYCQTGTDISLVPQDPTHSQASKDKANEYFLRILRKPSLIPSPGFLFLCAESPLRLRISLCSDSTQPITELNLCRKSLPSIDDAAAAPQKTKSCHLGPPPSGSAFSNPGRFLASLLMPF
ncbi:hypothetical protein GGI43DRAFT_244392 [Trichoderma evansii]